MSKKLDLRSNYKARNTVGEKTSTSTRRHQTKEQRKEKRANAYDDKRVIAEDDIAEENVESTTKKLPWLERYKMWKKARDEIRVQEREKKLNSKPVFKPAGVNCITSDKADLKIKNKFASRVTSKIDTHWKNTNKFSTINEINIKPNVRTNGNNNIQLFNKSADVSNNKSKLEPRKSKPVVNGALTASASTLPQRNTPKNIIRNKEATITGVRQKLNSSRFSSSNTKQNKNESTPENLMASNVGKSRKSRNSSSTSAGKQNRRPSKSHAQSSASDDNTAEDIQSDSNSRSRNSSVSPAKIRIQTENTSLLITPSTRVLRSQRSRVKDQNHMLNQRDVQLENDDMPQARNNLEKNNDSGTKTPKKEAAPVYVSPFVTVSRGKQSMQKEKLRRSSVISYVEDDSAQQRKVKADYYRDVVKNETIRLMKMHDEWSKYKEDMESELSEEAKDHINVVMGQTKLLISSKFEQFRTLIDECANAETGKEGQKTLASDLGSFWDLVFLQVNDINRRFDRLEKLKNNNWIQAITPRENKTKKMKPKKGPVSQIRSQKPSQLREHIKAARKKLPAKSPMLLQVLNTNKARNDSFSTKLNQSGALGKGILRTPGLNKSLNSSKSVLFRRSDCNQVIDFDSTLPVNYSSAKKTRKSSINLISWDSPAASNSISGTSTPKSLGKKSAKFGILS